MTRKHPITVYECEKCGWADFHLTERCPRCNESIRNSAFDGIGRIATYTTIRYPPKGFEDVAPYSVAIVDLENGIRVIGRISASESLKIGAVVTISSKENGVLEFQLVR